MSVETEKPACEAPIPAASQPAYDAIVSLTDKFCQVRLTWEYGILCRKLAGVLARKRPSPLNRGNSSVWACAILRVIGWVNFLSDPSHKRHMKLPEIDKAFGLAESTAQGRAKEIRKLLKIHQFDFHWMLRRRIEESVVVWMVNVNGFPCDVRQLPREIQEEAVRRGLIPYLPGQRPNIGGQESFVTQPANL